MPCSCRTLLAPSVGVTAATIDDDGELTDLGRAVLDFERQWWKYPGARASAIRERFDWSEARYAQVVGHLIEQVAAEEYDGMLVHRLRRLRESRRGARRQDG
jgi:hypothetical protein